jgi:hypothetical protein
MAKAIHMERRVASLSKLSYTGDMSETLTIRLGEDLAQALEDEASRTGLSKAEIVREGLERRLENHRLKGSIEKYFGIIEGPPDLSSNKKYLKTWGLK